MALHVELSEARRQGELSIIERRCSDLNNYLGDSHPPSGLVEEVVKLIGYTAKAEGVKPCMTCIKAFTAPLTLRPTTYKRIALRLRLLHD